MGKTQGENEAVCAGEAESRWLGIYASLSAAYSHHPVAAEDRPSRMRRGGQVTYSQGKAIHLKPTRSALTAPEGSWTGQVDTHFVSR